MNAIGSPGFEGARPDELLPDLLASPSEQDCLWLWRNGGLAHFLILFYTGHCVRLLGNRKVNGVKQGGAPLSLPKIRRNPLVEIIAVNTGCLNHCTYCKTKHARGSLGSYPPEEVVQRARQAFSGAWCGVCVCVCVCVCVREVDRSSSPASSPWQRV